MARILLHIGTHKTATTTIQNTFAANRALLARHGLIYPDLGRSTGHHGLAMRWVTLPEAFALQGGAEAGWDRVAALAKGDATVLISSEEFSRGLPEPRVNFRELRDWLSGFAEVQVICTLRDQLSYLQSIYLEVSKKHVPPPWPMFLANALASGFGAGLFLDFNALHSHLRSAFEDENIHYLDYTATSACPGGLLGAMLRLAGTDLAASDLRPVNRGAANVSPDALAAWAANQVAAPRPASPELLNLTRAALREELGDAARTTVYTRAEEVRLLTHFAPLNARFTESIRCGAPGFALTAPPVTPKTYREDLGQSFWVRIARRLHSAA